MIEYLPKVVAGMVFGTGKPIDGHVLYLSQWEYDNREKWHLFGWESADDEAVMLTMYQTEIEGGLRAYKASAEFEKMWKSSAWSPSAPFCIPLENVEVREVIHEEQKGGYS